MKTLFRSYDKDNKSYILLRDLDAASDSYVTSFHALLKEKYGNLDTAWRKAFNRDPHDSIDEAELAQACTTLGYPHDARKLFKCLQMVPGRQLITIWDLEAATARKRVHGKEAENRPDAWRMPKFVPNQNEHGEQQNDVGQSASMGSTGSRSRIKSPVSAADVKESLRLFYLAINRRHGSTVGAWRNHFDPDLRGNCGFGRFVIVVDDCGFFGNVKSVWQDLSGGKATITFRDLDPQSASILDECREFMVSACGSILKAWHSVLDPQGRQRLDEAEFLPKMVGRVKNPKKLFRLLLARLGQRSVSIEELEALLITVPAAERKAIWGGADSDAVSAEEVCGGLAESPPKTPSSPSKTPSGSFAEAQSMRYRDYVIACQEKDKEMDRGCQDLASFKKLLVAVHGSLFSAWRRALDVDKNGVVTHLDFARASQRLGVKAVQKIWSEFDKNKDGHISLRELDPECAELFNSLEQLLIEMYGSTKEGWRKAFDKDGSLHCDRDLFVYRCKAAGFQGDADKLFTLLRPEPSRSSLTFDDLWININANEFHLTKPEPNTTQGSPKSLRTPSPQHRPTSKGGLIL